MYFSFGHIKFRGVKYYLLRHNINHFADPMQNEDLSANLAGNPLFQMFVLGPDKRK